MTTRAGVGLVLVWLASLPLVTVDRVACWRAGEACLWAEAARLAPEKARPVAQLADLAWASGDRDQARLGYRRVFLMSRHPARPRHERRQACVVAVENLARLAQLEGQWGEALRWSDTTCE